MRYILSNIITLPDRGDGVIRIDATHADPAMTDAQISAAIRAEL